MKTIAACLLVLLSIDSAQACSAAYIVPVYEPKRVRVPNDLADPLTPPLNVEIVEVRRPVPSELDRLGCPTSTRIRVKITANGKDGVELGNFGYYFRSVSGETAGGSFRNLPLKPEIVGKAAYFTFHVPELPADHHPAIQIEAEVFAVNPMMQIGPATRFLLFARSD